MISFRSGGDGRLVGRWVGVVPGFVLVLFSIVEMVFKNQNIS